MRMWKIEFLFATTCLFFAWIISGMKPIEIIGSIAVLLTFSHVQVSSRLDEEAKKLENDNSVSNNKGGHTVECRAWLERYLIGKESCWCIYFIAMGAYSALVGAFLFLAYPFWRRIYNFLKGNRKDEVS